MEMGVGSTGGTLSTWGVSSGGKSPAGKRDLGQLEQSRDAQRLNLAHCIPFTVLQNLPWDEDPTHDARHSGLMMRCSCRVLRRILFELFSTLSPTPERN
jgi:hypothetical protein